MRVVSQRCNTVQSVLYRYPFAHVSKRGEAFQPRIYLCRVSYCGATMALYAKRGDISQLNIYFLHLRILARDIDVADAHFSG